MNCEIDNKTDEIVLQMMKECRKVLNNFDRFNFFKNINDVKDLKNSLNGIINDAECEIKNL